LASLKIPDDQLETLGNLVNLSDQAIDNLLKVLSQIRLSVEFNTALKKIASTVTSIKEPEKLARVLVSLSITRAHSDPPIPDFVDDVLLALEEANPKLLSNGKQKRAREIFTRLLSCEPLNTAAKAHHLLQDQERMLSSVRILTDARPVFGQNPTEGPVATLINHTLKITYYQDGKVADFYIALDTEDISALRRVLDRAEAKAVQLKKVFTKADIPIVYS